MKVLNSVFVTLILAGMLIKMLIKETVDLTKYCFGLKSKYKIKYAHSEQVITFDCDDTLIRWEENWTQPFEGSVKIVCPHTKQVSYHRPHKRHISFLKKHRAKGYTVVVWSSAGTLWASEVVKSLKLEEYVDIVMSKPCKVVDDLPRASDIIPVPFYLSEKGHSL